MKRWVTAISMVILVDVCIMIYHCLNTYFGLLVGTICPIKSKIHFLVFCWQGCGTLTGIEAFRHVCKLKFTNLKLTVVKSDRPWSFDVFSSPAMFSLLQSKVWNTAQGSGEEIWRTARSFDQFTAGVQESSGPVCWQGLMQCSSWPATVSGEIRQHGMGICNAGLD